MAKGKIEQTKVGKKLGKVKPMMKPVKGLMSVKRGKRGS